MHEVNATPTESWTALGTDAATGRRVLKARGGYEDTRDGATAGTPAWVEQAVDKMADPTRYRKKVTLSDGSVAKDVDRPLTEQSAHGPQTPPP